jgi:hypothetical protein
MEKLWNITTLKISQFYDGACEETPRKHSQAGESRPGCPNLFFIEKTPQLNLPFANGAELTRRNGTDSGRPFVHPSVVIVVNARSRRPKETDGQGQTDGRTTVLSCVAHQSRPSADTPHCPRTAQETTDQLPTNPLPTFRSIMWAHPPTPRPPRPAGPTTPRVSTLNRPKASLPCHNPDNKQTNGLERPSAPSLSHQARSDSVNLPETSWHPRARE